MGSIRAKMEDGRGVTVRKSQCKVYVSTWNLLRIIAGAVVSTVRIVRVDVNNMNVVA